MTALCQQGFRVFVLINERLCLERTGNSRAGAGEPGQGA